MDEPIDVSACGMCELPMPSGPPLRVALVGFDADRFAPASFARAGMALPPAIARSVRKRQAEFFFGRLAARRALRDAGCATPEVDIGTGPQREPLWPAGWTGAIAHTTGRAAAAALDGGSVGGLGIDLERAATADAQSALAAVVFDAGEWALMDAAAPALPLAARLTLGFSAKECFYKAAFGAVGRCFGFDAVRVEAVDCHDGAHGTVALRLVERLGPVLPAGRVCVASFMALADGSWLTALRLD